jgi:hypothetical protein
MLILNNIGPLAQLVEQLTLNQLVAGSNPAGLTIIYQRINTINDYRELGFERGLLFLLTYV